MEGLKFVVVELMFDEEEIDIQEVNLQNLKPGILIDCLDEDECLISKVFVAYDPGKEQNYLVEKRRFNKSWKTFIEDKQVFTTFDEWKSFIISNLLNKEQSQ
jgi:hypothetical protein